MSEQLYGELADQVADRWGLSRELIRAQVQQESSWRPEVESSAGAIGLLQLLPGTAREEAEKRGLVEPNGPLPRASLATWRELLTDPALNLHLGASYLARQVHRWNGDIRLALASYNAGPGRVSGLVQTYGANAWSAIYNELPRETQGYVDRILDRAGQHLAGGWSGGALLAVGVLVAGALAILRK